MKTLQTSSEVLMIGGLVVAVHLAFVSPQLESGLESAGAAGADILQVMASTASIATLVENWDSPPEIAEVAEMPTAMSTASQMSPTALVAVSDPDFPAPSQAISLTVGAADAPPLPVAPSAEPPKVSLQSPIAPSVQKPPNAPALFPKTIPPQVAHPPKAPAVPKPPAEPVSPSQAKPVTPPKSADEAKPKPASQSAIQVQSRRASGAGGDTAKGNNGSDDTATISKAKHKRLAVKWGQQIRNRVARHAPKGVGKGRAIVGFTVAANGKVSAIKLLKSSGNARIDQAALKSVRLAGNMPRAPRGLEVSSIPMAVPIFSSK
ncbi:energy transducer TonB family protein [Shimia sp. Alg240-R146]|uniref:energy transducer TonB family protein n=1 Tax=Shimia sp. Alg240-R146 TaxID=2993449 RepID=UPI0022E1BDBA|nr:energy transducer TonB [Shimia sp. Alg240-R146]